MGTKVAGTYVPVEPPAWAVVTEIPWAETYRWVIHEALWSVGITLAIALLASLLGVYLARWLAAPLVKLTSIATRIAGGEMELSAVPECAKEVVSLARAFNHMTGRLRTMLRKEEDRAHRLQQAIVERRHAEEALQESESRFRQMAENIREVLMMQLPKLSGRQKNRFLNKISITSNHGRYPVCSIRQKAHSEKIESIART
jgi:methyl-accepting chemotaxis protein